MYVKLKEDNTKLKKKLAEVEKKFTTFQKKEAVVSILKKQFLKKQTFINFFPLFFMLYNFTDKEQFIVLIYIFTQRKSGKCSDFKGLKNIILSGDGQNFEDEELLNYYINRENEQLYNNDEQVTKMFFFTFVNTFVHLLFIF